jgi:hypothetical protein
VVKWALGDDPGPATWLAACEVRNDVRLALACRDHLRANCPETFKGWHDMFATSIATIDYVKDLL